MSLVRSFVRCTASQEAGVQENSLRCIRSLRVPLSYLSIDPWIDRSVYRDRKETENSLRCIRSVRVSLSYLSIDAWIDRSVYRDRKETET